jgi:hypothetical protein
MIGRLPLQVTTAVMVMFCHMDVLISPNFGDHLVMRNRGFV